MSMMHVAVDGGRAAFSPGETVEGTATWELDAPPRGLEVRLFWYTSGRGDRDQGVAASESVPSPGASGWTRFSFRLPAQPWSFSGQLITLAWAIELVAEAEGLAGRVDLVVAPGGREVRIDQAAPAASPPVG